MHDWSSGQVQSEYGLGDYKSKFGTVSVEYTASASIILIDQDYNNFHRIDIHKELLKSAFEEPGDGPKCTLKVNHKATGLDAEAGVIQFENGTTAMADLIVAADGIRVGPLLSFTPVLASL